MTTIVSTFSPSMMPHETLEAMFVQREEIVSRIVELVRESAIGRSKHHTLAIGPRGIGKTHLVSLVYHRVRRMEDLQDRLLVAWLREEEWGISALRDVLMRILQSLADEYDDTELTQRIEVLYESDPETAQLQAGDLLKEYVAGRTLLVLTENLGETFSGLGEQGQQDLRAYLQENPFFTILATAQSLFNGVRRRTSPFYGFFRIVHLEQLTFDEATELLARIASLRDDSELASFVRTPAGRARVRAVHHLAGGNHRVYVIFSHFVTRDSLDALVDAVMKTLEELTPYYQSRMMLLAPLERKIVEHLCALRGAAPVKEIARRCFKTSQTVSGRLGALQDKGYVRARQIGRESHYELREPLMRICVEVKRHDGAPVRLLVDFLRIWYSCDELRQHLGELGPNAFVDREYLLAAIQTVQEEAGDPRLEGCLRDANAYMQGKEYQQSLAAVDHALSVDDSIAPIWVLRGIALLELARYGDALSSFDKAHNIDPALAIAHLSRGYCLALLGRFTEAIVSTQRAMQLGPNDPEPYFDRAIWLLRDEWDQGIAALDDAMARFPDFDATTALGSRGFRLRRFLADASWRPTWGQRGLALVEMFEKHSSLTTLAIAVVATIHGLCSDSVSNDTADAWLGLWQDLCQGREELAVVTRVLDVAVRYKRGPDERILLELPDEERRILAKLLGVDEDGGQGD